MNLMNIFALINFAACSAGRIRNHREIKLEEWVMIDHDCC